MGRRVESAFGEVGLERGRINEARVCQVLLDHIEQGLFPAWFKGYQPIPLTDTSQSKGIDGWILTLDVGKIPLQIKSSWAGKEKALSEHPRIPVVIVHLQDSEEEVAQKCLQVAEAERQKYLKLRNQDW